MTPSTTLTNYHISCSFLDDTFCRKCERNQRRPFLSNGVVPAVGMRIEVMMFLKRRNDGLRWNDGGSADNKVRPFRLSGEIVEVRDRPCLDSPPSPTQNQPRTRSQARRVTQSPNEHHQPPRPSPDTISRLRPSTSYEDVGYGRGSFHVADIVSRNIYPEIRNSTVCAEPTPAILDAWNEMGVHFRERVYDAIVNRYGAVHGQEIVCEARLNFDYDIRRGNENGPWSDLIPVDGRDIWRFTMAYDDQYDDDAWHGVPSSFENLGRNHRNRCWPWTEGNVLPYRRTGADEPVWGSGPGGALQVHTSLGPFLERSVARMRPNSLQAYAA